MYREGKEPSRLQEKQEGPPNRHYQSKERGISKKKRRGEDREMAVQRLKQKLLIDS